MKHCTQCGHALPQEANFCPYCMAKLIQETNFEEAKPTKLKRWRLCALGVAIFLVLDVVAVVLLANILAERKRETMQPAGQADVLWENPLAAVQADRERAQAERVPIAVNEEITFDLTAAYGKKYDEIPEFNLPECALEAEQVEDGPSKGEYTGRLAGGVTFYATSDKIIYSLSCSVSSEEENSPNWVMQGIGANDSKETVHKALGEPINGSFLNSMVLYQIQRIDERTSIYTSFMFDKNGYVTSFGINLDETGWIHRD